MKRILPFLLIALLIACSGPQENKNEEASTVKEEHPLVIKEVEKPAESEVETNTANPDVVTVKPADDNSQQAVDPEKTKENEISFLFNKATTAYDNDDFERGISLFEDIVSKDPENRKAFYNLGVGYFKIDKFNESIRAFDKAIEIEPGDSSSLSYRGRVYYMMGNFRKSYEDYDKVVELKPDDPISYFNRATASGRMQNYLGAIQDFDKAIELNPRYGAAFYNRGLAYFYLNRLHEACYDWNKALSFGHYEADKAIKAYCEDK